MKLSGHLMSEILDCLPVQRGNVAVSNDRVIAALLHLQQSGCRWRDLPAEYGNWHTVYTRVRRWERRGVLQSVLKLLRKARAANVRIAVPQEPNSDIGTPAGVDPARFVALADELRPLIFTLYAHLKQERREFSLSQFEVTVLMAIESTAGVGTTALARQLEVRPTSVSVALRRLGLQGWVTAAHGSADDRRRVGLRITPAGRKVLDEVRVGRSDQLVRQFGQLEPTAFEALESALLSLKRLGEGLRRALPISEAGGNARHAASTRVNRKP
jgi:DNA-binding MarR family transcriptional regulator